MPPRDEESRFEQVLARHLRRGETGAGCPDAATLAAYHERALTAEEMNAFKGHIAACTSCQDVLAGLEASEGVIAREEHDRRVGSFGSAEAMPAVAAMPAVQEPRVDAAQAPRERPKRIWKWMAPAAAVAAGLLVWVGVRQVRNVPRGTTTVAVNTQPSAPSDAGRSSPALRAQAPAQSADAQASLADKRAQPALPAAPPPTSLSGTRKEADELTAQVSAGTAGKDQKLYQKLPRQDENATERYGYSEQAENEVSALTKQRAIGGESAARGGQKAPALPSAQVAMEPGKKDAEQQFAVENAPGKSSEYRAGQLAASEKAKRAVQEERQKRAQADNDTVAIAAGGAAETKGVVTANEGEHKFSKAAGAPQPATVAGDIQAFNVKSAVGLAVAPEKRAMWAVGAGGMILKSLDGGTTWVPQASGVAAELLAGSAPSATVCWVVGRGGTILRTTDGEHWERVASPVKSDLIGIEARGAQTAAVWISEKLPKYVTRDGGKTWQRTEH